MAGLAEMTPVHVRETRAGARSRKSTSPKPNGGTGGGVGGQNGNGGTKRGEGRNGEEKVAREEDHLREGEERCSVDA